MNRNQVTCLAIGTLIALAVSVAQAQSAPSASAAPAAGAASMSAKEARAANRRLQKDVLHVLARTKGLSVSNITVRANDGAVTLEGAVPDQAQIELAGQAAANVPGVKSVKNALALSTF